MPALEHPRPITVAEYLAGEQESGIRHEYLGGAVHAMAGGDNRHNAVATNALIAFGAALRGKACRPFNSDTKVRIETVNQTRFYYPDAMVVCAENPPGDHFQDQPVVITEVLSDSTRRIDLGEKRDAYLTLPSLKVLMLVEPAGRHVRLDRRKPDGGFVEEIHSGADAVIALPEIDASLALADLFDGVAG